MNLREIEVVCELSNYKNFSEAAYGLSYSPSVITKYVSNLEKELGVRLFIRSKKAGELMLTPEGKILLNSMRRIGDSYHYMMELAKQMTNVDERSIRIGSQSRLGNRAEQEIIANYLAGDMDSQLQIVKADPKELCGMLSAGKLDAAFLTVHKDLSLEDYLPSEPENSDIKAVYLGFDGNMYLGISEEYMPGVTSAPFRDFRNFTFVFPFRNPEAGADSKLLDSFNTYAEENGFSLKTMFIDRHENALFRLASMKPVAISTTTVFGSYPGIKFVRVEDWPGGVNEFFLYSVNNRKSTLRQLRRQVESMRVER